MSALVQKTNAVQKKNRQLIEKATKQFMNISDGDSLTNIQVGHSRGGTLMNTLSQFS